MDQSLPALHKALDTLESFLEGGDGFTPQELLERLPVPHATLYRQLRVLSERGYLRRDPQSGRYKLGFKILQLALTAERQTEIVSQAQGIMSRLLDESLETVSLAIPDGVEVVYVKTLDSPQALQAVLKSGFRAPLHSTAAGKAILAYLPEERFHSVVQAGLRALTSKTVRTPELLRRHLERVRRDGFARNQGEWREGAGGLYAPVFGFRGEAVAAIGISGPSERFTGPKIRSLIGPVCRAANELSRELGASPNHPVLRMRAGAE